VGRCPWRALDLAIQVAHGLAAAHAAGIVHRDIKPANVMLTRDGLVKVVDFGIAKLMGRDAITRTGIALGTVAYMAPEQVLGHAVDHRADLWALGVVLYEMLAGRPPFAGDHPLAVANAVAGSTPAPPRALRSDLSPELERIVLRALA
jgi:eukaryotic-like serine/threonine-protein kinase